MPRDRAAGLADERPDLGLYEGAPAAVEPHDDGRALTLGVAVTPRVPGKAVAARVYRGDPGAPATRVRLWDPSGRLLSTAVLPGSPREGWVSARWPEPVTLRADVTYRVGYDATDGRYLSDRAPGPAPWARSWTGTFADGVGTAPDQSFARATYALDLRFRPAAPLARPSVAVPAAERRWACAGYFAPLTILFGQDPTAGPPCRSDFPGSATTGAPAALPEDEVDTITRDGTVIEDVTLRRQLRIEADDVVLRRVRVLTQEAYGILVAGGGARLESVSVVGTPGTTMAGVATVGAGSFEALRLDVSRCEDGVRLGDDSELRDSWIHDLAGGGGAHFDGVVAEGAGGWRIHHNTIVNDHDQTSAVSFGLGAGPGEVTGNYLAGGGYTLYAGPDPGTGLRVEGNLLSRAVWPRGGSYGPVTGWSPSGNSWRANRWADGSGADEEIRP